MEIENLIHEIRCRLPFEQQLWAIRQMLLRYKATDFFDDVDQEAYKAWCVTNGSEGCDWFDARRSSPNPVAEIVPVEAAKEIVDRHHEAIIREYGDAILRKGD